MLDQAYKMIEADMQGRLWATGDDFTMADCAALPGLFFASIVHPFTAEQQTLSSYLERLLQRVSVKRVLAEAQPYFSMFPYREAMPARYLEAATS
jgi:glutathione S-transferase